MGLYEDRASQEEILEMIPPPVLDALRERGHSDNDIDHMKPETMFNEYLEWEGIIGFDLWNIAMKLRDNFPEEET